MRGKRSWRSGGWEVESEGGAREADVCADSGDVRVANRKGRFSRSIAECGVVFGEFGEL